MEKQRTTPEERKKLVEDIVGTLCEELKIDEVMIKENGKM